MRTCIILAFSILVAGCRRSNAPIAAQIAVTSVSPAPTGNGVQLPHPTEAAEPTPTPVIYAVGGEVSEPVEIHRVMPKIPDSMRKGRMRGVLIFKAVVETDGTVSGIHSARPVPVAARECVDLIARQLSQWRYTPAKRKGEPVRAYLTVTMVHGPC